MIDLDKIHIGLQVRTSDEQRLGAVKQVLGHMRFLNEIEPAAGEGDVSVPLIWILAVDTAASPGERMVSVRK